MFPPTIRTRKNRLRSFVVLLRYADWADAVSIAENHKAHLMAAVLPLGMAPLEAGKVYVKLLSSCLAGEHAIAVYTSGTVLEPGAYQRETQSMREGERYCCVFYLIHRDCLPFRRR